MPERPAPLTLCRGLLSCSLSSPTSLGRFWSVSSCPTGGGGWASGQDAEAREWGAQLPAAPPVSRADGTAVTPPAYCRFSTTSATLKCSPQGPVSENKDPSEETQRSPQGPATRLGRQVLTRPVCLLLLWVETSCSRRRRRAARGQGPGAPRTVS